MLEKGAKFGRLTVVEDKGCAQVICICYCGTEKVLSRSRLRSGDTKSCGCLKSDLLRRRWRKHSAQKEIPVGTQFGRLTVTKNERQYIICSCSCGSEKRIYKYDLLNEKTKSCGCFSREVSADNLRRTSTKHGEWNSKEWRSWYSMIKRCTAEYETGYHCWGGRGIRVCAQWSDPSKGFVNFLKDMGRAPSAKHFLDRIDNDGNYEPGNVRWATAKVQARNRRTSRYVDALGKKQTIIEWSEETGIGASTISKRLRSGWLSEEAVSIPPDVRNRHTESGVYVSKDGKWDVHRTKARNRKSNRNITAFGKTQCLQTWAEETGINRATIAYRLNAGWNVEEALKKVPS